MCFTCRKGSLSGSLLYLVCSANEYQEGLETWAEMIAVEILELTEKTDESSKNPNFFG